MGLLTGIVLLPLAPVRGVTWLAEQVRTLAEDELADRASLSERLAEIERARDAGEISYEESVELEEQILDELELMTGE